MMPLCWSVLLLCLSANAEDTAVYRWVGESVTLKCSSEGCPRSVDGSIGMYLNRHVCKGVEEVLYYHRRNDKISLGERFNRRIETTGSLMNHTITVSRLTMEDAGGYHCVYLTENNDRVECNGYTLVVRDPLIRQRVSFETEDILVYGRVGESVTFKCSSEGCPCRVEEYIGLYLYRQDFLEEEAVLYYHGQSDKISPHKRFNGRIETTGSLMNHYITISGLTRKDAGFYRCLYMNKNNDRLECNGHTLVVREDVLVYGEVGESVTFKCSSEGRPRSVEEYIGLYLYQQEFQEEEEVLYYHGQIDNISLQKKIINRIETTRSLMNHTITVSSLTMKDAGFYRCIYVNENGDRVQHEGYILIVRGKPQESPSLVLVIVATCAISSLVTVIFILLIQRTKQWIGSRRPTTRRVSNNNVYEVMTRNALRPPADPEQSPQSPYDI